jgi:8-oxo-dGTP pyrophosphatase MutT (NUDIX family)
MIAKAISLERAKEDKLFYFVANVVIYRESDGRCLLLKRADSEKVHPGKYAVPGGKLEWTDLPVDKPTRMNDDVLDYEDAVENLLVRETREEAGIEIDPKIVYVNSVAFIRPDGIPVMLLKFAAKYVSGEVKLEEGSFTDFAWATGDEADGYDCIKGVPDEVRAAAAVFSKTHDEVRA